MAEEYRPIPECPGFEISREGKIRNRQTGHQRKVMESGSCQIKVNRIRITVHPDEVVARVWGIQLKRQLALETELGPKRIPKYTRTCHDCGKPTTNYRCDRCWSKIRSRYY